ncbi:Molybdopterin-guanine dinucleotide biosynthesis protein A [Paramicrobacterium humi]|uniref:Molybdopterin-guanine dinucleotide biosynthesis protein A n=1 Tax=Paramicrobacterium humi TaxID=640635 RepID=A0A1H4MZU2_9MICO|nr:NTP transferase domain-containing protein [Microbacterium humi]SEB88571.1 Molybdopterin-guanine dinucleotide biosynthesis protein A [Microbacterium humi]
MTAAIVLGGGRASRLGGADKASVEVDGRMLLDHVLAAVADCSPVVVAGPAHLARPGVTVVREDPPYGGPVAGLAAALGALGANFCRTPRHAARGALDTARRDDLQKNAAAEETWLLACDLPRAADIVALLRPVPIPDEADAVILADADGRPQWLAGRYRTAALRTALAALPTPHDASMRRLVGGIRTVLVPDAHGAAVDLDTWAAIDHYRSTRREPHA